MPVYSVCFKPHVNFSFMSEKMRFYLIETDHADLEQFMLAMDADDTICARALITQKGEGRERIVRGEIVFGIHGSAVDAVELPLWKIVREVPTDE